MQLDYPEVDENLEEVTCHGPPAFPTEVYLDNLDLYPDRMILWHWHRELEFVCILIGIIELQAGARIYVISEGQGGPLPPNMLHMVNSYRRQKGSTYCTVLADPYLLHGLSGGAVETRYVSSLIGSGEDFLLSDNSCFWHGKILDFVHETYVYDANRPAGYLWKLQILVQQSGLTLFEHLDERLDTNQGDRSPCGDIRYQKVRACLKYIHQEYAGKIRLEDTAGAACVSINEYCRDLRQALGQVPMDYLISHHIRMGEYLLAHSDKSVLETTLAVGFSGGSHFSNTFLRYRGCTPLNYRKREGKQIDPELSNLCCSIMESRDLINGY